MNNTRIGLSNLQLQNSDGEYVDLGEAQEITLENDDILPIQFDFTQPTEISFKLRAKKYGITIERYLYFMHSKKARIRRKYTKRFYKLFGVIKEWIKEQ